MKRLRRAVRPYDEARHLAECYARSARPAQPPEHHFELWRLADTAPGAEPGAPALALPFRHKSLLHALRTLAAWRHVRVDARALRAWVASAVHHGTPAPNDDELLPLARLEHGLQLALGAAQREEALELVRRHVAVHLLLLGRLHHHRR